MLYFLVNNARPALLTTFSRLKVIRYPCVRMCGLVMTNFLIYNKGNKVYCTLTPLSILI